MPSSAEPSPGSSPIRRRQRPECDMSLRNTATNEERTVKSSAAGVYQFVSLAPGPYEISATMNGFRGKVEVSLTLETNQTLNVPINLVLGTASETVQVSSQAPLLDSADTRLQETLPDQDSLRAPSCRSQHDLSGHLGPGVTGTGVTSNGSPGSGRDNYSTETQVDASANGQGAVGNMYIVDGLDVTSSIRPGVLNLTPNPDSIAGSDHPDQHLQRGLWPRQFCANDHDHEIRHQTAITAMPATTSRTRSSFAGTEFTHSYLPFHSNNISATIGGPIVPRHHARFFFFSVEPLRASSAITSNITFEDPAFTAFAKSTFPNTVGTLLLSTYPVSNVSNVQVAQTAASIYPANNNGSPICGTPSTFNLPCGTAVLDSGNFSSTAYRNGNAVRHPHR